MNIHACGVQPIIIGKNGDINVLCGREVVKKNWDSSNRFAGFGGMKENDESNRRCAARECYEESMGFFGTEEEIFKKLNKNHPDYIGENVLNGYKCYWIKYDLDDEIITTFKNVYNYLKQSKGITTKAKNGFFEKTELKYFTLRELYILSKTPNTYTKKTFRPNFLEQLQEMVDTPDVFSWKE